MRPRERAIAIGGLSALLLLAFYLGTLSLVSGREYARSQFAQDWPFLLLLLPGFGSQVGLYVYIRSLAGAYRAAGTAAGASGGVSGASMVACCAHYLPTLLPFVGVSAGATLIMAWRTPLLVLAVAANAAGLAYMVHVWKKVGRMTHPMPGAA